MKDTPERLIAEAAAHSQSTHNVVTSNAAASLVIRLATEYLFKGGAATSSLAASSTSMTSSMSVSVAGNVDAEKRMQRRIKRYENRKGMLEESSKLWLRKTRDSYTPNTLLDRVTLVGKDSTSTEWYLPLPEVYAIVLSALMDKSLERWPVPVGSSPEKERLLRLREFDQVNNALAKARPAICSTGIRHAWLMALDGYEGKRLPLNAEDVLAQGMFDFMVQEVLAKRMGITLAHERDPVGDERVRFNQHFQSLFLPWVLGEAPESVCNVIADAKTSESALSFVLSRFEAIGFMPDDIMMQRVRGSCSEAGLEAIPCNFTPLLATLHAGMARHASALFLRPNGVPATSSQKVAQQTIQWLRGPDFSPEALNAQLERGTPFQNVYLVLRFLDALQQYKERKHLLHVCDMPVEDKAAWVESLAFFGACLQDPEPSLERLLADTPRLEERIRAFERGFSVWRSNSYQDFITNYFAQWFGNEEISARGQLFTRLCELYARETAQSENPAIRVSDAMLKEWTGQIGEDGLLPVEPYQINRILLHALCYPQHTWTPLFRENLSILLRFIRSGFNEENTVRSQALSRASYPEALLADIEAIATGTLAHTPAVLTPSRITDDASSLYATRLLASTPDAPESAIRAVVENPGFNPDAKDNNRLTPFYLAAAYGHIPLASVLLERGANYLVKCLNQYSSLYIAVENNHLPFLRWFLGALSVEQR
ncbi:ankyrin repeat domain-containing protein, partial [Legionella pneumophila]